MTKKVGDRVSLLILRDGIVQKISLALESKKPGEPDLLVLPPSLKIEPPTLPPLLPPYSPSIPPPPPPPPSQSGDILKDMYNNCLQVMDTNICDKIFGR